MKSKRNLYVLALGVFGITTTEFGVIGVLPEIASAFHISIEKAGWLLSAFALIVAVFGPFMLIALSSFKRKNLLISSLLIFAAANILSAYIGNFYALLIVRMLPAFFHPVYWSIVLSVAEKTSDPTDKSKAVSIIFSGLTLATVLGVPLATLMSDLFSWQSSFLLTAFINSIALIGVQFLLPAIETETETETETSMMFDLKIFKNKNLWFGLFTAFFTIAAMYSTYGYMADFLKNVTHMSGKQISIMLFMFGTVGILGNKLAGKYMSAFPFLTTCLFLTLLAVIHLLIYSYGSYFIPMVWIITFWGLIHSGGFLISNINVTSSVSGSSEFINSIFTSCGNFAVTAGTLLGGFWIAHYGIENVTNSSIICIISTIIIVLLKKKFGKYRF
ncbi:MULTISPECIES: MFS transporter [unclassified Chryseobacterium]|uniref:MFS transporter n=1 Tax=unclassified Chryseobacterium TaxID=2593645 RepID=UPI00100B0558|nr:MULTISPECIES: MFS transporter [unclassified Chryseobacterium]RXM53247.1 MFS transporter [Chryseobacterium sp. CH25]RXM65555.1 MFS transporter [Chryseobacterium sp. CH1]